MPTLLTNTFYTLVFAIASGTVRSLLTPSDLTLSLRLTASVHQNIPVSPIVR
ncbi:MAG: hypothetical protein V7K88_08635 [Nostoc sp.]|uniref:hypothetical protein n=1 Tax=Nostoc sp. TaxID=1180 RepID=UPI002FF58BF5